ncbi:MAG TPA: phosphatase PAP2 family protein [Steroidobacteraceae bacterium]
MNSLVGRSALFDSGIAFLSDNPLFGALFVTLLWGYWFKPGNVAQVRETREHLITTLWAGIASIVVARALALELPFRMRPRFEPALHFRLPASPDSSLLLGWSSFPSDHAVMYSALAAGLCFISWRLGLAAALYVVCFVCFPRAYLGYHYPTDLLVGVVVGVLCGYAFNLQLVRRWIAAPVVAWEHSAPRRFYMALFFLTLQFATMFDIVRDFALSLYHFAERLLGHR